MITQQTQKMTMALGLVSPKILFHIDGPSDRIGNSAIVMSEDRPKEGGIYFNLYKYKYPYKSAPPDSEIEKQFIFIKKLFRIGLKTLQENNNWRLKILIGIMAITPKWLLNPLLSFLSDYLYSLMSENLLFYQLLKPERYCYCAREVYRVLSIMAERRKSQWQKKLLLTMRDYICLILEFDNAYRFRFQDIMAEVRKKRFLSGKKEMMTEAERLFGLLIKREYVKGKKDDGSWNESRGLKARWESIRNYAVFALKWLKPLREIIKEFFQEVNLKKLSPDEGDRYFDALRLDYDFGGKSLDERIEWRKKIDGENWHYFEKVAKSFLETRKANYGMLFWKEDIKVPELVRMRKETLELINSIK